MSLLQDWVTRQANERPDAVALVYKNERVTYGELEKRTSQVAHQLKALGCQRGDRVVIAVPKSPSALIGILGILKADCAYVPLDTSSPAARLSKILTSCESRVLIAGHGFAPKLDELFASDSPDLVVGCLESDPIPGKNFQGAFSGSDLEKLSSVAPETQNTAGDTAYIMFTSGSTGTPKGVVITHENVAHFVDWAVEYFDIQPGDRHPGHIPLHFDLSVYDMFGAFARGAELHIVPTELNLVPHKLAQFIRDAELTQWFSVPSIMNHMAKYDVLKDGDLPSVKRVLWCGEVLPVPALKYWMERLPHATFTNLYGPTEATIASSFFTVPECPGETTDISIGVACPGEELRVLDEKLAPLPPGEIGDLYIQGVGLSPGYWKDQEKTDAAFLPDPKNPSQRIYKTGDLARLGEDGLVYYVGRADSQIKSRGYRIELGEIETAMNALAYLRECAIVAVESEGFEGAMICAAYVPAPDEEVNKARMRKDLSASLPNYMLPMHWLELESLPKNQNGKIDRKQLRGQFRPEPAAQ